MKHVLDKLGEADCLADTCHVAVSATTAIVLLWEQIKAAVDALTAFCVLDPSKISQGGRAYLGTQTKGRKRRREQNVKGMPR